MTMTVNIRDSEGNVLRTLDFPDGTSPGVIKSKVQSIKGTPFVGGVEAAATIGRGIVGEIVGGLGGIASVLGGSGSGGIGPGSPSMPDTGSILDRSVDVIKGVSEFIAGEGPETIAGERALQSVGEFIKPIEKGAQFIASGLVGLASLPFGGVDKAVENIESVRTRGLGETLGDLGAEVSPALGAIGKTTPAAILSAPILRGGSRVASTAKAADDVPVAGRTIAPTGPGGKVLPETSFDVTFELSAAPETASYNVIITNLKKGRTSRAAEAVKPDLEIKAAAEELGIVLNPSHYSTNRAFIDVEQAFKSRPGTTLATIEEKAIKDLGARADELIKKTIGKEDVSVSLFNEEVRTGFTTTIDDLAKQSAKVYKVVNKAIPGATVITAPAARFFLSELLSSFGGNIGALNAIENRVLQALTRINKKGKRVDKDVTYAELDRLRKDIGDGYKRQGPFRDESIANLDQVYSVLAQDQQAIATGFGVGGEYAVARKLIQSRKDLERSALDLFGRDMRNSLVPKIASAATKLTKGDVSGLKTLLNALPKAQRAEAAAQVLDAIFSAGSRIPGTLGQGFVKAWRGLKRNPTAMKLLFDELPAEVLASVEKIAKVATGIFRSKALENTSKTARDLIAAMDDGGMFTKIYKTGGQVLIAEGVGSALGIPGVGTTAVLVKAWSTGKQGAASTADALLTSPGFKKAVEIAAGGDVAASNAFIFNTSVFKAWVKNIDPKVAARITAIGFVPWLTEDEVGGKTLNRALEFDVER